MQRPNETKTEYRNGADETTTGAGRLSNCTRASGMEEKKEKNHPQTDVRQVRFSRDTGTRRSSIHGTKQTNMNRGNGRSWAYVTRKPPYGAPYD